MTPNYDEISHDQATYRVCFQNLYIDNSNAMCLIRYLNAEGVSVMSNQCVRVF